MTNTNDIYIQAITAALNSTCATESQKDYFVAAATDVSRTLSVEEYKKKLRLISVGRAHDRQVHDLDAWYKKAGIEESKPDVTTIRVVIDLEVPYRVHHRGGGISDSALVSRLVRHLSGAEIDGHKINKAKWRSYVVNPNTTIKNMPKPAHKAGPGGATPR